MLKLKRQWVFGWGLKKIILCALCGSFFETMEMRRR
jgi:hypothetical protein